jgi:hypothetical protein
LRVVSLQTVVGIGSIYVLALLQATKRAAHKGTFYVKWQQTFGGLTTYYQSLTLAYLVLT